MRRLQVSWLWALLLLVAGAAYGGIPADGKLDEKTSTEILAFQAAQAERANASRTGHLRLFSAQWCGYCRQAQAWLAANQVPYQNLDIDTREGMAEFVRSGKKGGIPLLLGPNVEVRGFSAGAYRAALRKPDR